MPKIQITAKGIRSALKKYLPQQSLTEYIWNGFDAEASEIKISYIVDALGNVEFISISDNGYGIPHEKLQEKFEPLFESKKALQNKLKKNLSAIHGKNGIGRLTFFTFARNAAWKTVYEKDGENFTYEIYANAENINLYTGVNATPKKTSEQCGTTVTFTGIHNLTGAQLEEKFSDFLLKEFAWFLALNARRNFSISINGKEINYKNLVADQEKIEIVHLESLTTFQVEYIRWQQKLNNEPSRYYYLSEHHKEKWKEPTAIKNKGEQFYHSVFIESLYFNEFSFQSQLQQNPDQQPLLTGTRRDKEFRYLRKKLATILRIKRRPFLKTFAEELLLEYEKSGILPKFPHPRLHKTIITLYEMQPRVFTSLNIEQKKILAGLLDSLLHSNKNNDLAKLISEAIDLTPSELNELSKLLAEDNQHPQV